RTVELKSVKWEEFDLKDIGSLYDNFEVKERMRVRKYHTGKDRHYYPSTQQWIFSIFFTEGAVR
ncbi:MAG: hypothetical protein J6N76_08200, partial [Lachnospiraceae bacterium]|nr:hypothetical protein [Lachnospiraceae bacterium]